MCCILACFSQRPSSILIDNIATSNRDGLGVAWIDRETGTVKWSKGIKEEQVFALTQEIPFPFMIHARWATVGGATPRLTHPFPIQRKPNLALAGSADQVLMHNGHVDNWREVAKRIGLQLPPQPFGWSDSRVIAAAVHQHGKEVLKNFSPSRFSILSVKNGLEIIGDWLKEGDGIYASSSTTPTTWSTTYGLCDRSGDDDEAMYAWYIRKMRRDSMKESIGYSRFDSEDEYDHKRTDRSKRIHEIDDEWWIKMQD